MLGTDVLLQETSRGWIAMRRTHDGATVQVGGPYAKNTISTMVSKLKNHGVVPSGWGKPNEVLTVKKIASAVETPTQLSIPKISLSTHAPLPEITPYERFGLIEPAILNIYGQYKNPRAFCSLICGSAGIGKTTEVEKVLSSICEKIIVDIEMINDSDAEPYYGQGYIVINGSLSSAQLYAVLEQYPACCIVIDDVDDAMKKADIVNVLMSATATNEAGPRRISKNKKGGTSFDFSGSIVLISNLPTEKNHTAMLSRSNTNTVEIILTPEEMKQFVMDRLMDGVISVSAQAMTFTLEMVDTYGDHPDLRPIDVRVSCQIAEEAEKELKKAEMLGTDPTPALNRMKTRILHSQRLNRRH